MFRIRPSVTMIPFFAVLFALCGPLAVVRDRRWEFDEGPLWIYVTIGGGAGGLLLGLGIFLFGATFLFPERGLGRRRGNGEYALWRALGDGERLVNAGGALKVEKPDGSLEHTRLFKLLWNKEDFQRALQALPVLDKR